jgi:cobalt-zinc-cadmium efflux system protein
VGSGHGHDHGMGAMAVTHRRPLAWVLAISTAILVVEVAGAFLSDSLALLADAGHMLTDVVGLTMALVAATLALRPATPERTWGYRRAEVLAAAAQAALLLAVALFVIVEGLRRLLEPPEVESGLMAAFAVVALVGNAVSMLVLSRIQGGNLNTRAAFLEVASDALGALAVLVAAVLISTLGWLRADAVTSIAIGLLILPRTFRLLRESVDVLLEATPRDVDLTEVRQHILGASHVIAVHDLHASRVSSDLPVVTAHVVVEDGCFHDGHIPPLLDELQTCLADHFDVAHSTFQFEPAGHGDHESGRHD